MGKVLTSQEALDKAVAQIVALGWEKFLMVQGIYLESCDQLVFSFIDSQGNGRYCYVLKSTFHDGQEYWYALKRDWTALGPAMDLDEALHAVWLYVVVQRLSGEA